MRVFARSSGSSFDAYYDWDIRTGDNYFSEHFDDMLGQPRGSARRWFYAWLELVHGDDKEPGPALPVRCVPARGDLEVTTTVCGARTAPTCGSRTRASSPVTKTGRPARMLGTIRDITQERETGLALEQAAELHRTLFRGAANPAVRVDREGRYLEANDAALAFWGRTPEEMRAHDFWGDFPAELGELVDERLLLRARMETEVVVEVRATPSARSSPPSSRVASPGKTRSSACAPISPRTSCSRNSCATPIRPCAWCCGR